MKSMQARSDMTMHLYANFHYGSLTSVCTTMYVRLFTLLFTLLSTHAGELISVMRIAVEGKHDNIILLEVFMVVLILKFTCRRAGCQCS